MPLVYVIKFVGPRTFLCEEESRLRSSQIDVARSCAEEINKEIELQYEKGEPLIFRCSNRPSRAVQEFVAKGYLQQGWISATWKGRTITLTA